MHWYGALNFVRCHLLQNEQCEWKGPLQQRLPSLQHCLQLLLPRDWFVELVVSADLDVQLDLAALVELAVPVELAVLAKLEVLAELAMWVELVVARSREFRKVTRDLAECWRHGHPNCRLSLRLKIVPDELRIGA